MDDLLFNLLFNLIARAAVAGFVPGIISGVWPVLLTSLVVVVLLLWLAKSLRR